MTITASEKQGTRSTSAPCSPVTQYLTPTWAPTPGFPTSHTCFWKKPIPRVFPLWPQFFPTRLPISHLLSVFSYPHPPSSPLRPKSAAAPIATWHAAESPQTMQSSSTKSRLPNGKKKNTYINPAFATDRYSHQPYWREQMMHGPCVNQVRTHLPSNPTSRPLARLEGANLLSHQTSCFSSPHTLSPRFGVCKDGNLSSQWERDRPVKQHKEVSRLKAPSSSLEGLHISYHTHNTHAKQTPMFAFPNHESF